MSLFYRYFKILSKLLTLRLQIYNAEYNKLF